MEYSYYNLSSLFIITWNMRMLIAISRYGHMHKQLQSWYTITDTVSLMK